MFKVSSRSFLRELARRRAEFSYPRVSYRITVPPEHIWWYWNEFGTASHAENGTRNPSGYKIPDPTKPGSEATGSLLVIPDAHDKSKFNIVAEVWHPGIHPHHMITSILREIQLIVKADVAEAILAGNFTLDALKEVLANHTMPDIKAAIVESFAANLNTDGVRDDPHARLQGDSAAQVFAEVADIVETT